VTNEPDGEGHRSGFVACLGRTNVGKSTLINRLLGEKIGIVSRKPQTTRRRVRGILNPPGGQIVLVDTPGITAVRNAVNESLEKEALRGVENADGVLVISDPAAPKSRAEEERVTSIVSESGKAALLALNKCDLLQSHEAAELIERYKESGLYRQVLAVSATRGRNIEKLLDSLLALLPEGPPLYPRDILSDQPERDFFAEMVREKIFRSLHHELPYSAAVVIDEVREDAAKGFYSVRATLYVERESQKGILIGQGGSVLKKIGQEARRDMERLTGGKVFLSLWVKVRKNWTRDERALREFGFE
jgi:GTP-binding protein Era